MFKKIITFIQRYFVDIIIQLGVYILTNESIGINYTPKCNPFNPGSVCHSSASIQSAQMKIFAIMLISIGINMAVRKYFHNKKA